MEFETIDLNQHPDPEDSGDSHKSNKRFVLIGTVLIIFLIIIAVITTVSGKKKQEAALASQEAASLEEASRAAAAAEQETVPDVPAFEKSDDEALNNLVRDYFDARLNADSSRIFEIFGRKDTTADEELEKKLQAQASWIQGFQDINVYTADGLNEGEKLCLATYSIDFRRTDTLAPGVMYFYAVPDGSGSYTFDEAMEKDRVDLAEEILSGPEAAEIINDTDAQLKEALDRDGTLSLIYLSFQNGEIYKESDLDVDKEQSVDLFMNPEDSVLVGEDVLENIREESEAFASQEAAEGEADVYETDAADDTEAAEETSETAETETEESTEAQ